MTMKESVKEIVTKFAGAFDHIGIKPSDSTIKYFLTQVYHSGEIIRGKYLQWKNVKCRIVINFDAAHVRLPQQLQLQVSFFIQSCLSNTNSPF